MNRQTLKRSLIALLIAPLALGLAACSKGSEEAGGLSGDVIDKVAAPAGKTWGEVVIKTPEGGMRMGNPEAPIKLVEFGSMTCPHCAEFAETSAAELRDTFVASGRVSFEFRNFIRDPIDLTAAMLARCGAPESFHALTDQLFANQPALFQAWDSADAAAKQALEGMQPGQRLVEVGKLAGLTEFVAARGIAKDQANACLANVAEATALTTNTGKQAEELDITGTPTFLVNGKKLDAGSWAEVKAKLETMGAR